MDIVRATLREVLQRQRDARRVVMLQAGEVDHLVYIFGDELRGVRPPIRRVCWALPALEQR